ncbi:MAG: hypothetical protein IH628_10295, partial [Proteobacteria bacterium]|nr:hypothetical protein [Pseudomonadota bacterium]
LWWDEIVAPGGKVLLRWFVAFILAPLAVLSLQAALLLGASRRRRWMPLAGMIVVIVIVGVAIWEHRALGAYIAGLLEWIAKWLRG